MNLDNYELVKAVNSAITGRRDHRTAYKRFIALTSEQAGSFCEAFRALAGFSGNLDSFKTAVAEAWDSFDGEDEHGYFFESELDAIEAVIGKSW